MHAPNIPGYTHGFGPQHAEGGVGGGWGRDARRGAARPAKSRALVGTQRGGSPEWALAPALTHIFAHITARVQLVGGLRARERRHAQPDEQRGAAHACHATAGVWGKFTVEPKHAAASTLFSTHGTARTSKPLAHTGPGITPALQSHRLRGAVPRTHSHGPLRGKVRAHCSFSPAGSYPGHNLPCAASTIPGWGTAQTPRHTHTIQYCDVAAGAQSPTTPRGNASPTAKRHKHTHCSTP